MPGLLYLGNWDHAQDFAALQDLGIKRYFFCPTLVRCYSVLLRQRFATIIQCLYAMHICATSVELVVSASSPKLCLSSYIHQSLPNLLIMR